MELETIMERSVISFQGRPLPGDRLPPESVPRKTEYSGFHQAVVEFKRSLIESTLCQAEWNRTRAAKFLGLQRTYLLRLMRDLRVKAPPPSRNGRGLTNPVGIRESREPERD